MNIWRHRLLFAVWMSGLLVGVWPAVAMAMTDEETRPVLELTTFGGYRLGGSMALDDPSYSKLDMHNGGLFGVAVGVGMPLAEEGDGVLEIMWTHQDSTLEAVPNPGSPDISLDLNIDQFHVNGLYLPPGFEAVRPYAIFGLGATRFSPTGDVSSLTRFSWSLGAGSKIRVTRRLHMRFEAKWSPVMETSSGTAFCNSATGQCFVTSSGSLLSQFDFTGGLTLRI